MGENNMNTDDASTMNEDFKNQDNEKKSDKDKQDIENSEVTNEEKNIDNDAENNDNSESKDELTIANEKIKELEDKYKRLLAEFDNFRKRSEKENLLMADFGATSALGKILPIVDNLERAIKSIPEDLKENPFVEGVDKTYKQVLKTFEDLQIKPIESVGKPFDANIHNAVMTDETSDAPVDTITEELQKGYMYKDQVLRHAMVKVKK